MLRKVKWVGLLSMASSRWLYSMMCAGVVIVVDDSISMFLRD